MTIASSCHFTYEQIPKKKQNQVRGRFSKERRCQENQSIAYSHHKHHLQQNKTKQNKSKNDDEFFVLRLENHGRSVLFFAAILFSQNFLCKCRAKRVRVGVCAFGVRAFLVKKTTFVACRMPTSIDPLSVEILT